MSWLLLVALTVLAIPGCFITFQGGWMHYPSPWVTFPISIAVAAVGILLLRKLERNDGGFSRPAFWMAPVVLLIQTIVLAFPHL